MGKKSAEITNKETMVISIVQEKKYMDEGYLTIFCSKEPLTAKKKRVILFQVMADNPLECIQAIIEEYGYGDIPNSPKLAYDVTQDVLEDILNKTAV